jgi:hypothetical protein
MGVDLHTRQRTIAMLDDGTGELVEKQLSHEGQEAREFYDENCLHGTRQMWC